MQKNDSVMKRDWYLDSVYKDQDFRYDVKALSEKEIISKYHLSKEEIIDGALMFISNPSSFWNMSGIELKKRMQDTIFPEGLVYDCESGFRTPVLSESYLLIKEIALAGDENPNVVAPTRLELVTSGL